MIYFIRDHATGLVKIGRSTRHSVRLGEIANMEGGPMEGLGVIQDDRFDEAELHRMFANLRHHGEWFHCDEELEQFISREASPFASSNDAPELGSVKLRMGVIESARVVAALRGITMTDLISDMVRDKLKRMEQEEIDKRAKR